MRPLRAPPSYAPVNVMRIEDTRIQGKRKEFRGKDGYMGGERGIQGGRRGIQGGREGYRRYN